MIVRRLWTGPTFGSSFGDLERMRRDMERLLDAFEGAGGRSVTAGVFPLVNVSQDADAFYVRAEVPGVKASDLEVTTARQSLSIAGERRPSVEGDVSFHRREREMGTFRRTVTLPGEFDGGKVEARQQDGVLIVKLPKAEAHKPRQITVKSS